jgi:hypothetical protein
MEIKRLALVLADISGYTKFVKMHTMSLLHAEMIITELLEAVIDQAKYPLTLIELEGDAAFLCAELGDNEQEAAQDILRQVIEFFGVFTEKEKHIISCDSCMCEACRNIEKLKLKAIVHCGEVAVNQIRQFERLAGEDVILVHRLLKNSVPAKEYIMMTDAFFELSGGITGETPEMRWENVDGIGSTKVQVYYPAVDKTFPPQPAPNFPIPGSEYRAMADRWNSYAQRRIDGQETRRNFSSLPDKKMTLWNRFDYFVLSDVISALHIRWRKLTKKD